MIFDSEIMKYKETINNLCDKEKNNLIEIKLMKDKPFITFSNRSILIEWMLSVSQEFGFNRQTFEYSIFFVDKYICNIERLKREDYQLIGATSLYMASKLEVLINRKCKPEE